MKPLSEVEEAQYTLPTLNELDGAVPEGNEDEVTEVLKSDANSGGLSAFFHAIAVLES